MHGPAFHTSLLILLPSLVMASVAAELNVCFCAAGYMPSRTAVLEEEEVEAQASASQFNDDFYIKVSRDSVHAHEHSLTLALL